MSHDRPTPMTSRAGRVVRWVKRRSWWVLSLVAVLILVAVAGGGMVALIEFRGYCGSDFLPFEDDVTAAPYVQDVTSTAATIMWRTADPADGRVAYGAGESLGGIAEGERAEVHEVELTGLAPDTTYTYRVTSDDTTWPAASFRTAPGPDGEITMIVVGDTGTGNSQQWQVAKVMEGMDGDLLLHTGDVVYQRGAACHYEERYYDPYEELIASVPVYPVLGNHDLLTDDGDPYLAAFALPQASSGTERYYSFDYGPVHVAALDTELYYGDDTIPAERQKEWLREDLRATDRPWKIVLLHRPPFSSSPYHGGDRRVLEDLVGIFEAEGVDVVFAGHEHLYERLEPIDGVTYIVTGGGGGDLRAVGTSERTAASALRYHALKVTVSPERLVVEAVGIDRDVFDQVELTSPQDGAARAGSLDTVPRPAL